MGILQKLKNINKKWFYVLFILIILGIGGAALKFIHERNDEDKAENNYLEKANPMYLDLLYLESSDNLKISPEQAKVILPLVEKVDKSNSQTEFNLLKSIYSELNPQQYQAILTRNDNYNNKNDNQDRHWERKEERRGDEDNRKEYDNREEKRFGEGDNRENFNDLRELSLSNVILKTLKERALEQPAKAPVNTTNSIKVLPSNPVAK